MGVVTRKLVLLVTLTVIVTFGVYLVVQVMGQRNAKAFTGLQKQLHPHPDSSVHLGSLNDVRKQQHHRPNKDKGMKEKAEQFRKGELPSFLEPSEARGALRERTNKHVFDAFREILNDPSCTWSPSPKAPRFPSFKLKGFPKSGTTWYEYLIKDMMLNACAYELQDCRAKAHDRGMKITYIDGYGHPTSLELLFEESKHDGVGHIMRQHGNATQTLVDLCVAPPTDTGFTVILRDPRDVLVSAYFFVKPGTTISQYMRSIFVEMCVAISNIYLRYMSVGGLTVSYEALKVQPTVELRRLALYIGLNVSLKSIESAVKKNDFDRMKAMEDQGTLDGLQHDHPAGEGREASQAKVRAGVAGGYRAHFTGEELAWMEDVMTKHFVAPLSECYVGEGSGEGVCDFAYDPEVYLRYPCPFGPAGAKSL